MSKNFVYDTVLNNMLGAPSGHRITPWRVAKALGYNMPKFILYDAAWGGFAEGLGIREPRELRTPWDKDDDEKPTGPPVRPRGLI
jgi:hypothetical protein